MAPCIGGWASGFQKGLLSLRGTWGENNRKLVQVLRPPIGGGSKGRLYGVAFHPSRPLLAVGGTSADAGATSVFLFDAQTGAMTRAIDAGPGEVKRLVWSRDGRWLAGSGLRGSLQVPRFYRRASASIGG